MSVPRDEEVEVLHNHPPLLAALEMVSWDPNDVASWRRPGLCEPDDPDNKDPVKKKRVTTTRAGAPKKEKAMVLSGAGCFGS